MKGLRDLLFVIMALVFKVMSVIVFVLGATAAIVMVDAFVIYIIWPVVIPQLLPGMVAQGLITAKASFPSIFWLLFMLVAIRPANLRKIFSPKGEKDGNSERS